MIVICTCTTRGSDEEATPPKFKGRAVCATIALKGRKTFSLRNGKMYEICA
jgi:hypothetical protein